jgi:prephenate dehydrogenase
MQRVLIVGLGLVGGSIGLALRRWAAERTVDGRKPLEVFGFDPNLDHQRAAEKLGAVDKGAWDLARAVWSTQVTRDGELLQATGAELQPESVSDHMGRMFLGGFAKRLRTPPTRDDAQRPKAER